MGAIEDCRWVDMMIDEIGFALTKADETIQKGIGFWKELTKDIFDDQQHNENSTGQPNNGNSGEEHSFLDKIVPDAKESPFQHWAMCRADPEKKPNQPLVPKILKNLKQEKGGKDCYDDDDFESFDEDEEHENTSPSCDSISKLNTGSLSPSRHHNYHNEKVSYSDIEWRAGYKLLSNVETSFEEDDVSWDDWGDDDDYQEKEEEKSNSKSCGNTLELNSRTSTTSYRPSSHRHHNEKDSGLSLKWSYELLKAVETSSEKVYEICDDDAEVEDCYSESEEGEEMLHKHRMCGITNESVVAHDDEDDLSDSLLGFVDVRKEETENNTEICEAKTLLPECDWVYVTKD